MRCFSEQAVEYWDNQEASYNGVLGGFGHVSEVDVKESSKFLEKVRLAPPQMVQIIARMSC